MSQLQRAGIPTGGGERTSQKGTAYTVGQHWCHFKGISAEQVASCESRVSGYSESDRQRIAAKARGQRLKLLQRWFWDVAKKNKYVLEIFEPHLETDSSKREVPYYGVSYYGDGSELAQFLSELAATDDATAVIAESVKSEAGRLQLMFDSEYFSQTSPLNLKMSLEVLGYLSTRMARRSLIDLHNAVTDALCSAYRMNEWAETKDECDTEATEQSIDALILWVFSVDWASEFQRLEAESAKGSA